MARPSPVRPHNDRKERTAYLLTRLQESSDIHERNVISAQLIEINLPLCDALAARYSGRGADLEDLEQVARTALVVAVQNFRPTAGHSLAAFAVPTITGELKRYFRDRCWVVRPPRTLQELRPAAIQASQDLEQELGRTPSAQEIAGHLEVEPRSVEEALCTQSGYRPTSLDAPLPGDLAASIGSQLGSGEDIAETATQRVALHRALRDLPTDDLQILRWRFEQELTQNEIAARLGVSQMQVSRILRRILGDLRTRLETDEPAQDGPTRLAA